MHCSQQVYSNYELGQCDIPTKVLSHLPNSIIRLSFISLALRINRDECFIHTHSNTANGHLRGDKDFERACRMICAKYDNLKYRDTHTLSQLKTLLRFILVDFYNAK